MRGFASYLFLVFLVSLGMSQFAFQASAETNHSTHSTQSLAFQRTQLELAVDTIIEEKLVEGLALNLHSHEIKTNINQSILQLLNDYVADSPAPIAMHAGIGQLQTVDYFSLLQNSPNTPTLQNLNSNSHVLVLPLHSIQRYGEYVYTGGNFGSNILFVTIETANEKTLFALPAGYRVCAHSLLGILPCGG